MFGSNLEDVYGSEFVRGLSVGTTNSQKKAQEQLKFGTTETSGSDALDSPSLFSMNSVNLEESSNGMSIVDNKNTDILKKIYEYQLYLEQINNEKNYVEAQLRIFKQQRDMKEGGVMRESPPPQPSSSPPPAIPVNQEEPRTIRRRSKANQDLWDQFTGLIENQLFINILFYAFLVWFGIKIASHKSSSS